MVVGLNFRNRDEILISLLLTNFAGSSHTVYHGPVQVSVLSMGILVSPSAACKLQLAKKSLGMLVQVQVPES